MKLTLLIPHLLLPRATQDWQDPYRELALPSLEKLFARGRLTRDAGLSMEDALCRHFGLMQSSPVAAFSGQADGVSDNAQYWLRADPVFLQAQREQLMLIDGSLLSITAEEAAALIHSLNQYFAPEGLRFLAGAPERWYLALGDEPDLVTRPLPEVAGLALSAYLPAGKQALIWHKRITEAQMLLHTHAVNAAREARGAPLINSLWLWGGGKAKALARSDATIWADDAIARGLALAANTTLHSLPATAETVFSQPAAQHFVVWDKLRAPATYGDHAAWRTTILSLEKEWLAPALDALRKGLLESVEMHALMPNETVNLQFNRAALWRFWRRQPNLKHYAASSGP